MRDGGRNSNTKQGRVAVTNRGEPRVVYYPARTIAATAFGAAASAESEPVAHIVAQRPGSLLAPKTDGGGVCSGAIHERRFELGNIFGLRVGGYVRCCSTAAMVRHLAARAAGAAAAAAAAATAAEVRVPSRSSSSRSVSL